MGFMDREPKMERQRGEQWHSTSADENDMYRLGKPQEMKRNFRSITMFGFSMILMNSWEVILSSSSTGLVAGGTAGVIWVYIIAWLTFLAIYASLSEMGSMAPTSGGQYHWVSEFAPKRYQKILSYIVGWLSVTGWQTGNASTAFLVGTQIQGLLALNYEWYATSSQPWHGTLFSIAIALFSVVFNTFLARRLPLIEGIILVLHFAGFIGMVAVLWVMAPHVSATAVFTEFSDPGWGSRGVAALAGVSGAIYPMLGGDAAAHMSEELQDAAYSLPRTIMWTVLTNGVLGLVMIISYLFCITDLDGALKSATGYPFIQVFYTGTGSLAATNTMVGIIIVLLTFSMVSLTAAASRQLFAFARDRAVPGSDWLARVPRHWNVPINSILVSLLVTVLLSLINIGSTVAFLSISSLGVGALILSYIVSISCLVWRKVTNKPLLPSRFNLGSFGLVLNIAAIASCCVLFVFSFFPPFPLPDLAPVSMNWSVLIFGVIVIWSALYYALWGRHHYVGPVEYVRKLD